MGENKTPDSQKNTLAELLPGSDNETVIAGNPFEDAVPARSRQPSATTPSTPTTMQAKHPQGNMKVGSGPPMGPMPPGSMSGKVYPPNQPMVFNSSNPNAPPIYPCGRCHKEVHDNDQGILCESGCNFWFHRVCSGLTEPAFTMLKKEIYAEWVCDNCLRTKNIPLVKLKP